MTTVDECRKLMLEMLQTNGIHLEARNPELYKRVREQTDRIGAKVEPTHMPSGGSRGQKDGWWFEVLLLSAVAAFSAAALAWRHLS